MRREELNGSHRDEGRGVASAGQAGFKTVGAARALARMRFCSRCGWWAFVRSDLNSYRGRNPLVSYPRIPGHEVRPPSLSLVRCIGVDGSAPPVTLSPYTSCGQCAACMRGRANACQFNQTLGVQRDGALTEFIAVPALRLYRANLSLKELCLVEPLTVGFHAAARGRVVSGDTVAVFGCGE